MTVTKNYTVSSFILAFVLSCLFVQCSEDQAIEPQPEVNTASPAPVDQTATVSAAVCSSCTYVVPANISKGVVDGKVLGFKPGDVICVSAAIKYGTLVFKNIVGTAASPIIITNCGGTANLAVVNKPWNIKFSNSKYFRFTGGNTAGAYGLKLSGSTSNGLVLCELSTNFEVDHVEVYNVGFAGIMAKTDPTCDDATIRGNFTMRDISLHDNYVHDTKGEGFYIGHTSYGGYTTPCGTRLPHTIEGSKIYNNIVRNSGWDGIQLSCATKNAALYGNTIENYGTLNKGSQQNGILLGAGTGGLCYGNFINKGTGNGLTAFGLGDNIIHDNIVIDAGILGMFCDERDSPGPGFKFINNTIINPKTEGIRIYSKTMPDNAFINNIVVNPGSYPTHGEASYIMLIKGTPCDIGQNYFTRNIADVKFVNPAAANYHLQSTSPVINKGRNVASYSIVNDFYNTARLKGTAYDIGATEY